MPERDDTLYERLSGLDALAKQAAQDLDRRLTEIQSDIKGLRVSLEEVKASVVRLRDRIWVGGFILLLILIILHFVK